MLTDLKSSPSESFDQVINRLAAANASASAKAAEDK
jgi:hypothetical protein